MNWSERSFYFFTLFPFLKKAGQLLSNGFPRGFTWDSAMASVLLRGSGPVLSLSPPFLGVQKNMIRQNRRVLANRSGALQHDGKEVGWGRLFPPVVSLTLTKPDIPKYLPGHGLSLFPESSF